MNYSYARPHWCIPGSERDVEVKFLLSNISNILGNNEKLNILDVGFAGSGYIEDILRLGNIKYTGFDACPDRISGASLDIPETSDTGYSREKWRKVLSRINTAPIDILGYNSDTVYDIVMSISVIEHIVPMGYGISNVFDYHKDIKAVESMKRLVGKDGYLLLTFPCGEEIIFSTKHKEHKIFVPGHHDILMYDNNRIKSVIGDWNTVNEEYWVVSGNGKFKKTTNKEATSFKHVTSHVKSLCLLLLKRD